jgi:hypothetical protein
MEFSYGAGEYVEGDKKIEGKIILSEHKLYLKGPQGDLAQSYIPLEKIEGLRKTTHGMEVHVRPSLAYRYVALIKGENKHLSELTKDIVERRGLKKRFLRNEWVEEAI